MSSLAFAGSVLRVPNPSSSTADSSCHPIPGPRAFLLLSLFSRTVRHHDLHAHRRRVSSAASNPPSPAPAAAPDSLEPAGLYAAKIYELTAENVNLVLDEVRPYLIADGGDVDVVSVEDGIVSLKLQGACGTCPSSTTTMKMGIERVLKEKFGEAIKDIRQVAEDLQAETTVEAVNNHLEILRPAVKNYGGTVEVVSVDRGDCHVKYVGPESIGSGIKAAIKERFPDIVNVVFVD